MKNLNELSQWYENLTADNLDRIKEFYSEDAFFKDPFNEHHGRDKIKHIFVDMFQNLQNPRFVFIDTIHQGNQVFFTWDFIFSLKGRNYVIHGSSHMKFDEESKVNYHRDYWDVGEELLLKIPVIKSLYGILRSKIGSSKKHN